MTKLSQTRYGVRGLTCNRCLVSALEAVRALPGLRRVAMSLVPSGESLLTVTPSDVATGSELRALLGSVGFELTLRRNAQPASSDQAPERATSASALPPLTAHERTVPMTHHPHTDTTPTTLIRPAATRRVDRRRGTGDTTGTCS